MPHPQRRLGLVLRQRRRGHAPGDQVGKLLRGDDPHAERLGLAPIGAGLLVREILQSLFDVE
ncbi:hypothetical protein ACFXAF_25550 [Kitasatospora sp. NPDC059463]|uniref:hypothetical protein n=1 Tax=unclassified Kitasatospora TaxID=2633591 RepID=UPI0036B8C2F6